MEESLSILEEEKFASCRYCNLLVSSLNPTCQNCGLEMSSEGIVELAEFEEIEEIIESNKFNEVFSLRIFAIISLVMNLFGYLFYTLGLESFFKLFFLISLITYISNKSEIK